MMICFVVSENEDQQLRFPLNDKRLEPIVTVRRKSDGGRVARIHYHNRTDDTRKDNNTGITLLFFIILHVSTGQLSNFAQSAAFVCSCKIMLSTDLFLYAPTAHSPANFATAAWKCYLCAPKLASE